MSTWASCSTGRRRRCSKVAAAAPVGRLVPVRACFRQQRFQEICDTQDRSPPPAVLYVKVVRLHADDVEHVLPLRDRDLASCPVPLELAKDDVLSRLDRKCPCVRCSDQWTWHGPT